MKIRTMAATLAGLLVIALPSFAQITSLEGVVMGEDGKPVQGAVIQISRVDQSSKLITVKTDKKGHYIDSALAMGTYNLAVLVDDVVKDRLNGVKTSPTEKTVHDFDLKVAAAAAAALQKAASTGTLSKDQARGLSVEQKKQLEDNIAKQKDVAKHNAALTEAYNAGRTALENKQYDVAIESFNKAGEIDPKQDAVWTSLAMAYEQLAKTKTGADFDTNMQKAADCWTKAIALDPNDAGIHNNYALTLAASKKFSEAQAELEKAATLNPAGAGQYYYNLGALEINAGQNDAASDTFKKAISITPPYAEAFYQYGITLVGKASYDKDGKIIAVPGTVEAFQEYLQLKGPNGEEPVHAQEAKAMLATLGSTLQTQYKNPDAGKKKKKTTQQ
ncbi:MAG: tetratricopeptide repeat protein [Bryobacteraceae bacterium]|jgi:tetratricopeptide (TPR) repeat protein